MEDLIPVRLDFQYGEHKIQDILLWKDDDSFTAEQFSESFCMEMNLPKKAESLVATQIQRQVEDYKKIRYRSSGEHIFLIRLDLTLNGITLTDQFEWNINDELNSPENFAKILCADVGLGNEFEVSIAHSIREQIMVFKKKMSEHRENEIQYFQRPIAVENPFRDLATVANWGPTITLAANPNPNQKKFVELRSVYEEERRKKKDREYEEIIRADIIANTRPSRSASAVALQKMEES